MTTKYKVTVTFEVTDEFNEIRDEIEKAGLEVVQQGIASGFLDPEFSNVQCKLEEL